MAKCLGAVTVCEKSLDWTKHHHVICHVLEDKEAVDACLRFLGKENNFYTKTFINS